MCYIISFNKFAFISQMSKTQEYVDSNSLEIDNQLKFRQIELFNELKQVRKLNVGLFVRLIVMIVLFVILSNNSTNNNN